MKIQISENFKLQKDEKYAGVILASDGSFSHHLILLPYKIRKANWRFAMKCAEEVVGFLPTCREQSILFGNLKEEFESAWYWSGEQYAADDSYAWMQDFYYGSQGLTHKSNEYRARAVRRVYI